MGLSLPTFFVVKDPLTAMPVAGLAVTDPEAYARIPDMIKALCESGMSVGAFTALLLDNVIPGTDEERGINAWSAE